MKTVCHNHTFIFFFHINPLPDEKLPSLYREREGGSFIGTFQRKTECISGFLCLGPRGHSKLSMGANWNFSKEQGSPELTSDCGAKKGPL